MTTKYTPGPEEDKDTLIIVLKYALSDLLTVAERELDQSATHDGLINCDVLAQARAAIEKAGG
jgi:hypothetical protein